MSSPDKMCCAAACGCITSSIDTSTLSSELCRGIFSSRCCQLDLRAPCHMTCTHSGQLRGADHLLLPTVCPGCFAQVGYAYGSSAAAVRTLPGMGSAGACCRACSSNSPICAYWSFRRADGTCWLMSDQGPAAFTVAAGLVSGRPQQPGNTSMAGELRVALGSCCVTGFIGATLYLAGSNSLHGKSVGQKLHACCTLSMFAVGLACLVTS
jgi:hypothetical protein